MTCQMTAQELYQSRKNEIDQMANDLDSPLLREYALTLKKLVEMGDSDD